MPLDSAHRWAIQCSSKPPWRDDWILNKICPPKPPQEGGMKPHNKTGREEKERYRKTTKLKRRKAPTAARGRGSSAADLQEQLDRQTRELVDAREQQAATTEILRVISSSPTDVQPVFDTVVRSAVRLCDGLIGALNTFDGELMQVGAVHNYTPEACAAGPGL